MQLPSLIRRTEDRTIIPSETQGEQILSLRTKEIFEQYASNKESFETIVVHENGFSLYANALSARYATVRTAIERIRHGDNTKSNNKDQVAVLDFLDEIFYDKKERRSPKTKKVASIRRSKQKKKRVK